MDYVIQESIHRGTQSVEYTLIQCVGKHRFRVLIDRDSYDQQSSAVAYVWDQPTSGWVEVCRLPWENASSATYNKGTPLSSFLPHRGPVMGGDVADISKFRKDDEVLPKFREDAEVLIGMAKLVVDE